MSRRSLSSRLPARASAPAKVNLGLFLGPTRADGKHELASVMQSISLADELTLELAGARAQEDEVLCPKLPGPAAENIAWQALHAFRARTGWDAPPLRLTISKRIPVAAGLGGGSADAAATLRLARYASGLGDEELLRELGAALGADVPAQIVPGRWLASGAGERLQALPDGGTSLDLLVLAADGGLSTAAVYAEADRLGLARPMRALEEARRALQDAWTGGAGALGGPLEAYGETLHNDLQEAALALFPEIAGTLEQARMAGADRVLVSGSGPTVIGLFSGGSASGSRARRAAAGLSARSPAPICATPAGGEFAQVLTLGPGPRPASS
jgi:4-diphosphocytidyl-2-C-methyl-D-erythritol kinase